MSDHPPASAHRQQQRASLLGCDEPEMAASGNVSACLLSIKRLAPHASQLMQNRCSERAAHTSAGRPWRQHLEGKITSEAGLPLLRRFDGRLSRFDLHPGAQVPPPHYLDCAHSSFEPGSFDVEAAGVAELLKMPG